MTADGFIMHYTQGFHIVWGAEIPNQFLGFCYFAQLSGQVIKPSFGVFMPPSPNAVWSHWVFITTNPFHSSKINGIGTSLTPKVSLFFLLQHLGPLVFSFF